MRILSLLITLVFACGIQAQPAIYDKPTKPDNVKKTCSCSSREDCTCGKTCDCLNCEGYYLDYGLAMRKAKETNKPLVVFVKTGEARPIRDCIVVLVTTDPFERANFKGIIVTDKGGGWHLADLPARANDETIREAIRKGSEPRQAQPRQSFAPGFTPVYTARGGSC